MSISGNMVDNFGSAGFAGHLGNGMNSGGAGNLGDNMTSFNRGDYLFDNGDINTMFSNNLSAGCLNFLGDSLRDGMSYRGYNRGSMSNRGYNRGSMSNRGMSKRSNASNCGETSIEWFRISFSFSYSFGYGFGFTFDDKSRVSNMGTLFVNDFLASLLIGDFLASNIFSFTNFVRSRGT